MTAYDEHDPTARVFRGEIEVDADPETIWQTIATGPGFAAWFVPAEVEEREGGRIVTDHGPFGTSEGVVTVWDPPHRFAYEERDWNPDAPEAPPWATELLVEAREGGTCVVRLVSGFFSDGEGWEEQIDSSGEGWPAALTTLRLSLTHFPGMAAQPFQVMGTVPGDREASREELMTALGLDGVGVGDDVAVPVSAPLIEGTVDDLSPSGLVIRTSAPAPGVLTLGVFDTGPMTAAVGGPLYGEGRADAAARLAPRWATWMGEHLDGFAPMR